MLPIIEKGSITRERRLVKRSNGGSLLRIVTICKPAGIRGRTQMKSVCRGGAHRAAARKAMTIKAMAGTGSAF